MGWTSPHISGHIYWSKHVCLAWSVKALWCVLAKKPATSFTSLYVLFLNHRIASHSPPISFYFSCRLPCDNLLSPRSLFRLPAASLFQWQAPLLAPVTIAATLAASDSVKLCGSSQRCQGCFRRFSCPPVRLIDVDYECKYPTKRLGVVQMLLTWPQISQSAYWLMAEIKGRSGNRKFLTNPQTGLYPSPSFF